MSISDPRDQWSTPVSADLDDVEAARILAGWTPTSVLGPLPPAAAFFSVGRSPIQSDATAHIDRISWVGLAPTLVAGFRPDGIERRQAFRAALEDIGRKVMPVESEAGAVAIADHVWSLEGQNEVVPAGGITTPFLNRVGDVRWQPVVALATSLRPDGVLVHEAWHVHNRAGRIPPEVSDDLKQAAKRDPALFDKFGVTAGYGHLVRDEAYLAEELGAYAFEALVRTADGDKGRTVSDTLLLGRGLPLRSPLIRDLPGSYARVFEELLYGDRALLPADPVAALRPFRQDLLSDRTILRKSLPSRDIVSYSIGRGGRGRRPLTYPILEGIFTDPADGSVSTIVSTAAGARETRSGYADREEAREALANQYGSLIFWPSSRGPQFRVEPPRPDMRELRWHNPVPDPGNPNLVQWDASITGTALDGAGYRLSHDARTRQASLHFITPSGNQRWVADMFNRRDPVEARDRALPEMRQHLDSLVARLAHTRTRMEPSKVGVQFRARVADVQPGLSSNLNSTPTANGAAAMIFDASSHPFVKPAGHLARAIQVMHQQKVPVPPELLRASQEVVSRTLSLYDGPSPALEQETAGWIGKALEVRLPPGIPQEALVALKEMKDSMPPGTLAPAGQANALAMTTAPGAAEKASFPFLPIGAGLAVAAAGTGIAGSESGRELGLSALDRLADIAGMAPDPSRDLVGFASWYLDKGLDALKETGAGIGDQVGQWLGTKAPSFSEDPIGYLGWQADQLKGYFQGADGAAANATDWSALVGENLGLSPGGDSFAEMLGQARAGQDLPTVSDLLDQLGTSATETLDAMAGSIADLRPQDLIPASPPTDLSLPLPADIPHVFPPTNGTDFLDGLVPGVQRLADSLREAGTAELAIGTGPKASFLGKLVEQAGSFWDQAVSFVKDLLPDLSNAPLDKLSDIATDPSTLDQAFTGLTQFAHSAVQIATSVQFSTGHGNSGTSAPEVKALLDKFGTPELAAAAAQPGAKDARDAWGRDGLHFAAWTGTAQDVKTLLDAGFDANARTVWQSTPAHFAAHARAADRLDALARGGADMDATDLLGVSPSIIQTVAAARDLPQMAQYKASPVVEAFSLPDVELGQDSIRRYADLVERSENANLREVDGGDPRTARPLVLMQVKSSDGHGFAYGESATEITRALKGTRFPFRKAPGGAGDGLVVSLSAVDHLQSKTGRVIDVIQHDDDRKREHGWRQALDRALRPALKAAIPTGIAASLAGIGLWALHESGAVQFRLPTKEAAEAASSTLLVAATGLADADRLKTIASELDPSPARIGLARAGTDGAALVLALSFESAQDAGLAAAELHKRGVQSRTLGAEDASRAFPQREPVAAVQPPEQSRGPELPALTTRQIDRIAAAHRIADVPLDEGWANSLEGRRQAFKLARDTFQRQDTPPAPKLPISPAPTVADATAKASTPHPAAERQDGSPPPTPQLVSPPAPQTRIDTSRPAPSVEEGETGSATPAQRAALPPADRRTLGIGAIGGAISGAISGAIASQFRDGGMDATLPMELQPVLLADGSKGTRATAVSALKAMTPDVIARREAVTRALVASPTTTTEVAASAKRGLAAIAEASGRPARGRGGNNRGVER